MEDYVTFLSSGSAWSLSHRRGTGQFLLRFLSSGSAWSLSTLVTASAFGVIFLSSGSAWSLSPISRLLKALFLFLSSGSAWSLSFTMLMNMTNKENFYPQAPHGACREQLTLAEAKFHISILRLRMEPVYYHVDSPPLGWIISILRLRMEPVSKKHQKYVL